MGKIRKIFLLLFIMFSLVFTSCKKDDGDDNNNQEVVTSISISNKSQLEFNVDEFDLSKIIIEVKYNTNKLEEVKLTKEMVKTNIDDILTVTEKKIDISYLGFNTSTTITIKHPVKVESISVQEDSILEFTEGEFDPSYIYLKVVKSDKTVEEVEVTSEMIIAGLEDINTPGKKNLTISYEQKTVDVEVTIIKKLAVTNVSLSDFSKRSFEQNNIDYSSLLLKVTYEDNTSRQVQVKKEMIDGDTSILDNIGVYNITICYEDFNITCEIVITPEVIEEDFIYEELPYGEGYVIAGYIGSSTSVVIPSRYNDLPVTEIAPRAFYENSDILRVIIPESIEKIGEAAFYKAKNISSIIVCNPDVEIENYAFASTKLIYLEGSINPSWPEKWYDAQNSFIQEDVRTKTIKFDGSYEYFIKNKMLCVSNYIGSEEEIVVKDTYSNEAPLILGGACFKGNSTAKSITLPNTIKEIEKYGLAECVNLTNITLPTNLEILGDCAIRGCIILEHITLPSSLKEIKQNAFNMCSSLLEMIIPMGVESIEGYAFAWCVKITKIYIPSSVVNMGAGACYACSKATIYLEGPRVPETWTEGWNMSNRPIRFNQIA